MIKILWMGTRNPAPPKGWLKPQQNQGEFTIYQLVMNGFRVQKNTEKQAISGHHSHQRGRIRSLG